MNAIQNNDLLLDAQSKANEFVNRWSRVQILHPAPPTPTKLAIPSGFRKTHEAHQPHSKRSSGDTKAGTARSPKVLGAKPLSAPGVSHAG